MTFLASADVEGWQCDACAEKRLSLWDIRCAEVVMRNVLEDVDVDDGFVRALMGIM